MRREELERRHRHPEAGPAAPRDGTGPHAPRRYVAGGVRLVEVVRDGNGNPAGNDVVFPSGAGLVGFQW